MQSAKEVTSESGAALQAWRAIRVLEQIGSIQARGLLTRLSRGLLTRLSRGSSGARQTRLAKDALARLSPRR